MFMTYLGWYLVHRGCCILGRDDEDCWRGSGGGGRWEGSQVSQWDLVIGYGKRSCQRLMTSQFLGFKKWVSKDEEEFT